MYNKVELLIIFRLPNFKHILFFCTFWRFRGCYYKQIFPVQWFYDKVH